MVRQQTQVISFVCTVVINFKKYVKNNRKPYYFFCIFDIINKGVSIRKLCVGLGISMDEVMAFGDANNDLRMLEAVGYPVAMINGTDEVKAIAKDITKYTNVEDGVAKYIEEHFNEIVGG